MFTIGPGNETLFKYFSEDETYLVLDPRATRSDYGGDIYGLRLSDKLPHREPVETVWLPTGEPARWRDAPFSPPGNQESIPDAYLQVPLTPGAWTPHSFMVRRRVRRSPEDLFLIWDEEANGPMESHYACSTEIVSALCLRWRRKDPDHTYVVEHRYKLPVRMLVKGFRCPACTVEHIHRARSTGSREIRWAQTLDQLPFVAEHWNKEWNWPVPMEHTPSIPTRFVDLECPACGTIRGNQAHRVAGTKSQPPQGCPKCHHNPVSMTELVIGDVFAHYAAPGVSIQRSRRIGARVADITLDSADHSVVFEYDGSYWHRDSLERECAQTDLYVLHGFQVIRLRNPRFLSEIPGADNADTSEEHVRQIAVDAVAALNRYAPGLLVSATPAEIMEFARLREHTHRTSPRSSVC